MVALRGETQARGLSSWVCFLDHSISASKILASPGEGKALLLLLVMLSKLHGG